jgi:hypothetical protein
MTSTVNPDGGLRRLAICGLPEVDWRIGEKCGSAEGCRLLWDASANGASAMAVHAFKPAWIAWGYGACAAPYR